MLDFKRIMEIAKENHLEIIDENDGKHYIISENGEKIEFTTGMMKSELHISVDKQQTNRP